MRQLINEFKKQVAIIDTAVSIIFLTPEKDEMSEITALFEFVRDNIRYTRDVHGVETIANPLITLQRKVGDCDDKTTLFATLAEAVGYPTQLVMAGYFGSPDYEHVYCAVLTSQGWVYADTTEKSPLGFAPANPTLIFHERL
jgi:transglutaminase-like putative cysteine protease